MNVWNMSHRAFIVARRLECGVHDVTHFCNRIEMGHSLFSTKRLQFKRELHAQLTKCCMDFAMHLHSFRNSVWQSTSAPAVRVSTCLGTVSRRKSVPTLSASKRKCENNHWALSIRTGIFMANDGPHRYIVARVIWLRDENELSSWSLKRASSIGLIWFVYTAKIGQFKLWTVLIHSHLQETYWHQLTEICCVVADVVCCV